MDTKDKRLVKRITDHWDSLRDGSPMPRWEQLKARAIADIWPKCCVLEVAIGEHTNPVYTYMYAGQGIKEVLGIDPTGAMFATHFRSFPGARIVQKLGEVLEVRSPLEDSAEFINEQARLVKCRSCLLPFGNNEDVVTHIVLAISWREFE